MKLRDLLNVMLCNTMVEVVFKKSMDSFVGKCEFILKDCDSNILDSVVWYFSNSFALVGSDIIDCIKIVIL